MNDPLFSGNIYLLYTFDVGDDVNLGMIKASKQLHVYQRSWPKHFKHYHVPLCVQLDHPVNPSADHNTQENPHTSHNIHNNKNTDNSTKNQCFRINIHHFGALSFIYKINFSGTLTELKHRVSTLDQEYQNKSLSTELALFEKIKDYVVQPKFFQHRASYVKITITPQPEKFSSKVLIEKYGSTIASALRFETTTLSDFQIKEILESTTGYYQDDLVIIDTEAAFVYDTDSEELLDFFEQALVQQLELQYFDKLLDKKLDAVYERAVHIKSLKNYLPFIGTIYDPLSELSKLKVDISVITERLNNSIRLAGEPYYSRIYQLLTEKFELELWQQSIEKKLHIVRDVLSIYQNKINAIREDILSVLVIFLIMIEVLVAFIRH